MSMVEERKKSSLNSTLLVQFSMVMQRDPDADASVVTSQVPSPNTSSMNQSSEGNSPASKPCAMGNSMSPASNTTTASSKVSLVSPPSLEMVSVTS